MTDFNKDEIVQAVKQAIKETRSIEDNSHKAQHEWISMQIEREKRAQISRQKIKDQLLGWAIIAALSAIGLLTAGGVKALIHRMMRL